MLFRRWFKRRRTCSSSETNKQTCLCTTAKRDSLYDDLSISWTKHDDRKPVERYGLARTDKPRRLVRHANMDDSDDRDDDLSITEKLRRASLQSPANIPMLVVVSFHPDAKGLQKKQIEIQRGFPVNAQYIVNEWLFIRTADNEEGFVPYLCCRPMLRRGSTRSSNRIESSYKLYDFEFNQAGQGRFGASTTSALTPTNKKKLPLSTPLTSQSFLFTNSSSQKKRLDVTSSSCAGDSGVSDCESSSHHPQQGVDLSLLRPNRVSNLRSFRSSSNTFKQTGLLVHDLPLKKGSQPNQKTISRPDDFSPLKSQLSISSNSAFTQIVKKNPRRDSTPHQVLSSHIRSYQHETEVSSASSFKNHPSRPYDSYDDTTHLSSPSSKYLLDDSSSVSSPFIRRTPFVRRSLPHHYQPILKKSGYARSTSSPDPFHKSKDVSFRQTVFIDSVKSSPPKSTLERQFSDLSLNQIENDSLVTARLPLPLSCSPSVSSTTCSSSDDCANSFIHIQMTNYLGERKPLLYAPSAMITTAPSKPTSFIHNVSITV